MLRFSLISSALLLSSFSLSLPALAGELVVRNSLEWYDIPLEIVSQACGYQEPHEKILICISGQEIKKFYPQAHKMGDIPPRFIRVEGTAVIRDLKMVSYREADYTIVPMTFGDTYRFSCDQLACIISWFDPGLQELRWERFSYGRGYTFVNPPNSIRLWTND